MREAAGIDLDAFWACASAPALQRIADLARKVLKAPAALISDSRVVRCVSDPQRILASEAFEGGTEPGPAATIEVPIRLSCGRVIGVLRVVDVQARSWSSEDRDLLDELAACLTNQMELKRESLDREKAEAALELAKAHLLAVADRIPGLVFERRKIDAARSHYTFFGSAKSQLPAVRKLMEDGSTGDLNFVHRDDREIVRAAILRSNLEETDLDLTFRVKDFDRNIRWLRSQSLVRRDAEGGVFWDGLIFDISDLVAAREDAEAARTTRDKLLADLNAELGTPLRAIIGLSDILKAERQPERIAAHAINIRTSAQSVLSILDQLVAEARCPAPATMEQETPPAEVPSRGAPIAPLGRTGARILLADDLDLNRKLIADMLGLEGHLVEAVADGAAAVGMVSRHPFDLVLMDMIMPVMDGITATKAIRALPAPACNVPIVALTAHSLHEQLEACLAAGMDATLTKPMSVDALNAAVRTWTDGRTKAA